MGARDHGTLVLSWCENHEWRVSIPDVTDKTAMANACQEAVSRSGVFQRYGIIPESVAFGVVLDAPKVRDAETPTYP